MMHYDIITTDSDAIFSYDHFQSKVYCLPQHIPAILKQQQDEEVYSWTEKNSRANSLLVFAAWQMWPPLPFCPVL
jgi:hypothetical protein